MDFITLRPTPILNTPHFHKVFGKALPFDKQKLVRAVEMVALQGMVFQVVKEEENGILQVKTVDYPSPIPIYLDKRSGKFVTPKKSPEKVLPSMEVILGRLKSKLGTPYVWGGNCSGGIPEWTKWYPPQKKLTPLEETHWMVRGVDCSGLLYEATDGFTPRNTSELMKFGEEVSLENVKPLDIIVYRDHVIIALNKDQVIESDHSRGGVVISPLKNRISEIEKPFKVRRFHPVSFQTP